MSRIHKFFAVTLTSLYLVTDTKDRQGCPIVKKIARVGESEVPVETILRDGTMVGITGRQGIMLYYPNRHSKLPERANMISWGAHTSLITGLFLDEAAARKALATSDRVPCDPRFIEETRKVLDAIGPDHPVFAIAEAESWRLRIPEAVGVTDGGADAGTDTDDIVNEG